MQQQQNWCKCSLCPTMEVSGEEEGKANEEVSESGWTMYLDQSIHDFSSYKKSLFEFEEEEDRNRKNGLSWFQQNDEEDSSMASDASSGPPQLLDAVNHKDCYTEAGENGHNDVSDVRNKPKNRRVEANEHEDLDLFEDTASSPIHSFKSGLTENEAQKKDFPDYKLVYDSHDQADAVNRRLDFLQSILPEAPMCREETVGVAMRYASALEQRIKAFQGMEMKKEKQGDSGALRERGLCLVPISTVWNAI